MRPEDADRLARLDKQRFIILKGCERTDDGVEGVPVARRLACAAIDDQLIRFFGDIRVKIVHEHSQRRLLHPAFAAHLNSMWRFHMVAWSNSRTRGTSASI